MDERALKMSSSRKSNRFIFSVSLILVTFILLQVLTIMNKGHGLMSSSWMAVTSAGFDSWYTSGSPDLLTTSYTKLSACLPGEALASDTDQPVSLTSSQVRCIKQVLSTNSDSSPVPGELTGQPNAAQVNEELQSLRKSKAEADEELQSLKLTRAKADEELQSLNLTKARADEELQSLKLTKAKVDEELAALGDNLRRSVEMKQLKDLTQQGTTRADTTWFMSSLHGGPVNGKPEEFRFPSTTLLQGRLLCLQGNHTRNGTMNSYGFAWKGYLPPGATYLPGLTFISDNYWDYANPYHSLTALVNFAAWRSDNDCRVPNRLITYHWGEVTTNMGSWVANILDASLGTSIRPDSMSYGPGAVCFEDSVVHRRGLGGMSRPRLNKMFEMVRCKVYKFCKVVPRSYFLRNKEEGRIDVTLLARTGARGFSDLPAVTNVVSEQCKRVKGCELQVVHISNLSFCEQVQVMSRTDLLITAHGAQLTNMIFMPKSGSVMEMYPKGWLEFAGVGQYIYSWLADWTELVHEGTWRDTEGPDCPYPVTETLKCFLVFKDRQLGLNATYLSSWTGEVLQKVQSRREASATPSLETTCSCDSVDVR